jgi:2-polyprenyl-3-methyl-5-hydroxy-6-metoxy-1,4-benzoquinol methylase
MNTRLSNHVLCEICHVDDATVVYPAGVAQLNQIVCCNRCGLMYANPRKDADIVEIEAWEDNPNFNMAEERPQRYEKERLQVRDYEKTREMLARLHPERGKLVEVGCGMGLMLQFFREDGWDVLGVEPDRNSCRHATNQLGMPTVRATLEDAGLPDNSADVVVMLHVIEHVPAPVQTLREVYRVLKPGGHLVLETPRYDTLTYKLLGRRERSLGCNGHIFFFTTNSLRRVYEAAGFELTRIDYVGRSLTLDRLMYNVGVISRNQGFKRSLEKMSRRLGLQKVRLYLNMRDMQRLCLQKAETQQ